MCVCVRVRACVGVCVCVLDAEINKRTGKAASTLACLTARVFTSPKLSVKTRDGCLQCLHVTSTLLYGRETWTTYDGQERRLSTFHVRSICHILGLISFGAHYAHRITHESLTTYFQCGP